MLVNGESREEVIRRDFKRAMMIDFHGARITLDVGFLRLGERFPAPIGARGSQDCRIISAIVGNITKKRSASKASGNYRSRSTTKPVTPKFIPLGSKVSMTMGKVTCMQKSNRALLTPA
ncbi:MAG: hypothetical protein D4R73_01040 [Deltaproteobacteria bacterium]|nr:MAG: hypothetical protein D4R73_01040 [Deltaproteobacteria bacterium]